MKKKLVYVIGTGVAIVFAYLKGLSHGQEVTESFEELKDYTESVEVEDIEAVEEEAGEHIGRVVESTEEEVESESESESNESDGVVKCKDSSCEKTFDTEHGMKIHYGRVHKNG